MNFWLSPDRRRPSGDAGGQELDAGLLDRIKENDVAAFDALLKQRWRPLMLYCRRILGGRDNAEDVAQEAFIRLWEHRGRWKAGSSSRAILYTIARNLALNERSSNVSRAKRLHDASLEGHLKLPTPQEQLEADEFRNALDRAVSSLAARQQEVLTLARVNGLSREEIAKVTGLSPQTVANYLVKALTTLRRLLGPFLEDR